MTTTQLTSSIKLPQADGSLKEVALEAPRDWAEHPQPYETRVAVIDIGRTSMTLVAEVTDPLAGTVHARARTVLVCGDLSGRPVPVPDDLRHALETWPAEPF